MNNPTNPNTETHLNNSKNEKITDLIISGYKLNKIIYEGKISKIIRGFDTLKKQPVVIKILNPEEVSPIQTMRFRQDFEIRKHLESDFIVKAYTFQFYHHRPFIVMEDFNAKCLNTLFKTSQPHVSQFYSIAEKSLEALEYIHKKEVIHKDIKPCNILLNDETGIVKLTDFGISTMLFQEHPSFLNPRSLEGTIGFISPEQTGRMNRFLDYRTDFYSIGATFYFLLSGHPPFSEDSPMAMIHAHLAKEAMPLYLVNKDVPFSLSEIIMKLLSKNPEDRYQSIEGILSDLKKSEEIFKSGEKNKTFALGKTDFSEKFTIPEKIYGRKKELNSLIESFFKIKGGSDEIAIIEGYSGSGKTVIVKELQKQISDPDCYFISGKYEEFSESQAYRGIIQAFEELISEILGENQDTINNFKSEISRSIGENGKILTDLFPKLQIITGPQKEIPNLGVSETRSRFNYTFREFVKIFTKNQRKLILFLDDMQWIDSASLGLLKALFSGEKIKNFLFIGSYRKDEVNSSHPVSIFLEETKKQNENVNTIELKPLSFKDTLDLVSDTVICEKSRAYKLCELIFNKTGANPFFIKEFLMSLYRERLISFSKNTKKWEWDIEKIKSQNITQNVVSLLIDRIEKLPEKSLDILKKAACIGSRTSYKKLFSVCEMREKEFNIYLFEILKQGMLIPVSGYSPDQNTDPEKTDIKKNIRPDYIFQHDRLRQAAYETIKKENRTSIHLSIGKKFFEIADKDFFEQNLFEIVNHMNEGRELLADNDDFDLLVHLNYISGKKAKNSGAYQRALKYFEITRSILPQNNNDIFYKTVLKELAETKYLCGELQESRKILEDLLVSEKDIIEKCRIYELLILICTMSASYDEALITGKTALDLLEVNLPIENIESETSTEVAKAIKKLKKSQIKKLINTPEAKDPKIRTAMKILIRLQATSYFFKTNLYPFILAKMVNLSLDYGHTPESAKGYASFGNIYSNKTKDYKTAYELGTLGLNLSRKFRDKKIECQSRLSIAAFLIHGVDHLKEGEDHIFQGYQSGLESGEIQYAGLLLFNKILNRFFQGYRLDYLEKEINDDLNFCIKTGNSIAIDVITPFRLAVLNLRKKTKNPFDFSDECCSFNDYYEKMTKNQSMPALFLLWLLKAFVLYLNGKIQNAANAISKAEKYWAATTGYFSDTEYLFLKALILASVFKDSDNDEKQEILETIKNISQILKHKSLTAPQNHLSRHYLVEAEFYRIKGENETASNFYDQAVESASQYDFIQIEAIANELCANFWTDLNKKKLSRPYLEDACEAYEKWGALRKIKSLEKNLPGYSSKTTKLQLFNTQTSSYPDSEIDYSSALDMESVAKTSRVISSEVNIEKLLKKLMRIMIESAGAQKGFIILKKGESLYIQAYSDSKTVNVLQAKPIDKTDEIAESVVRYVIHTSEDVIVDDISTNTKFNSDRWLRKNNSGSLLCTPLKYKDKTIGALYLENSIATRVFSGERLRILKYLLPQAAISIDNAIIFAETAKLTKSLEKEVEHRKKIQEELEKSEQKYREIFENTRDIYIETAIDGTIIEVSPSVVESAGYTREELVGEKVSRRYIDPADQKSLMENLFKFGKVSNFEAKCKTKNNNFADSSINAMVIKDKNGKPEKVIVSIRDITEKKQLELKLFHSQKMEAIGTLAGGIAHDFNNILAGITGYTDIAKLKLKKEPEKIPIYLDGISRAGERAKNLVSQILSFTRNTETKRKNINPLPVIKEALKLLRSSIPSSIEMVEEIKTKAPLIKGNTTQLHQVIMNLCTNAAHSMKETGGVLTTRIETININKNNLFETSFGEITPGDYLKISVKDTGHGIQEQIGAKIFDPYFTTKKTGEGTGLGLSMVHGIVKNHGGYLKFSSIPDKGTCFEIYFPLAQEFMKQPKQKKHYNPITGGEQILFVDDEEILAELMEELLQESGYKVKCVNSSVEALNLFNENPDKYDIIITDMTMPVMTGVKLCKEIFKVRPDIPAIICTGYSEAIPEKSFENTGIRKKLLKPFNIEELNTAIRDILEENKH
ncbi:MAG: AAA family ATPase [Desulfobacteraceae bacterium]|nr:AAA family ATPase [Desulfobacteraceae bacterium]